MDPFTHGPGYLADDLKTEALTQALDTRQFDLFFPDARRDEEKSRGKVRVFLFGTTTSHQHLSSHALSKRWIAAHRLAP